MFPCIYVHDEGELGKGLIELEARGYPICGTTGTCQSFPIEGWSIDPDVHGLFNVPCDIIHLPTQNREVLQPDVMTRGVGIVINGVIHPEMFLEPLPKGPSRFLYALIITFPLVTLVPVNYSLLCVMLSLF